MDFYLILIEKREQREKRREKQQLKKHKKKTGNKSRYIMIVC